MRVVVGVETQVAAARALVEAGADVFAIRFQMIDVCYRFQKRNEAATVQRVEDRLDETLPRADRAEVRSAAQGPGQAASGGIHRREGGRSFGGGGFG